MKRIKLTVSYDGTNYHGWQIQPKEITVEKVLNDTLSQLLKEEITVIGASRTDAGVHAMGNVAVFDTETTIPPEKIALALNTKLPKDIRIQKSEEVDRTFHPRHCNSKKTYEYWILNRNMELPTERLYTYYYYKQLDIEAMNQAAQYFLGEHDFKSFCSARTDVESTVRTIYDLNVRKEGEIIKISVTGSGFLYKIVRIISGTLVQVGLHKYAPESIEKIIEAKDRTKAGPSAPPQGLRLMKIEYENPCCDLGKTK